MKYAVIAGTLAVLTLSGPMSGPALAQGMQNCAPRDTVITRLAERYGEARHSMGLAANNQMVEVFAAPDTGTWTITVTLPGGMTCLVASGQAFETLKEQLPAAKDDA